MAPQEPASELRKNAPVPTGMLARFEATFASATQSAGIIERRLRIKDEGILLRFAGPALVERILPAFEHLPDPGDGAAGLDVRLWDAASTGHALAQVPVAAPAAPAGRRPGRFRMVTRTDGVVCAFDAARRLAFFFIENAAEVPAYESAKPLRVILHWGLAPRGLQILHGGAVGSPAGGVLLAGKGGSGKSTASLAALGSDLLFAGDDQVIVDPGEQPCVYAPYSSAALTEDHLRRFPELGDLLVNRDRPPSEKGIAFLAGTYPRRMTEGFPLRAVLIPRLEARRETTVEPAAGGEALRALAPSTVFQLPEADRAPAFGRMAELARRLPAFRIRLGRDAGTIAPAIASLLRDELGVSP